MAELSFGFTEKSFLLFNDQKHLKSVAEDLIRHVISNKQKRTKRIYQKRRRYKNIIKLSSQHLSTGHNFV